MTEFKAGDRVRYVGTAKGYIAETRGKVCTVSINERCGLRGEYPYYISIEGTNVKNWLVQADELELVTDETKQYNPDTSVPEPVIHAVELYKAKVSDDLTTGTDYGISEIKALVHEIEALEAWLKDKDNEN